jgi:predicted DNA-binding transcriptional regulator YafY
MRKASRLFEIIQILRLAKRPTTAAAIAQSLEVAPRSIYRDIAALQAMRIPIEGGRGIGYILRPGFDLPPLMFSIEETEAIVLALALLERTGDGELKRAARRVNQKIAAAMPAPLRQALGAKALHAWGTVAASPEGIDLALVRRAIREERKLQIDYRDEIGQATQRTIRPLALIYYSQTANIVAWCELRQALRNFRTDRVVGGAASDEHFRGEGDNLRREWIAGWKINEDAGAGGTATENDVGSETI